MKNIINELNKLDLSTYPIKEVKDIFNHYQVGLLCQTLKANEIIQRSVPYDEATVVNSVSQLSYNPLPKKYGRASVPAVPMFYGCYSMNNKKTGSEMICSTLEANADKEGIIYHSKWQLTDNINLACIIHPTLFPNTNNQLLINLKKRYLKLQKVYGDQELDSNWKQICELFSKPVAENKDYNYIITALLTQTLIEKGDYDGIAYPSVKTNGELAMNVALTKKAVDEKLKFVKAQKSKIIEVGLKDFHGYPLCVGESKDGVNINWGPSLKHN